MKFCRHISMALLIGSDNSDLSFKTYIKRGNYTNLHNMLCKKSQHCYQLVVDNMVLPYYVWPHRQLVGLWSYRTEATQLLRRSKQRYFPYND